MQNLIKLNDLELQKHNIPYKAATLKWWRAKNKYPELFKKIGHFVFLDLNKFKEKFLTSEEV